MPFGEHESAGEAWHASQANGSSTDDLSVLFEPVSDHVSILVCIYRDRHALINLSSHMMGRLIFILYIYIYMYMFVPSV
jgi:hypothetical protein